MYRGVSRTLPKDIELLRIAFYADALDYQYAGIYFYLRNLLDALHEHSDAHEYILVKSRESPEYTRFTQVIAPTKNFRYIRRFWRYVNTFPKLMNDIKPDVVIEPTHFGPFRLDKSIKRAAIIHDLTAVTHSHFHPRLSALIQSNFLEDVAQNADIIITNSEYTKTQVVYEFGIDRRRVDVLHPVIPQNVNPIKTLKPKIEWPYILHVGTLEPRKNLAVLVEAFDRVRAEYDGLKLVFVGKAGWRMGDFNRALANARWREDIILTDYISDQELLQWYDYASLCVFPSHIEGFGLPIAEALGRRRRVIVNDHASMKEAGSDVVYYTDVSDVSKLALRIQRVLDMTGDPPIPTGHLEKFGAKAIVKRFESIIERYVEKEKG